MQMDLEWKKQKLVRMQKILTLTLKDGAGFDFQQSLTPLNLIILNML